MFSKKLLWLLVVYGVLLAGYSLFSYALTAPNLILTSWAPYWHFQLYMWATFFNNRLLLAQVYLVLILALFGSYYFIWRHLKALDSPKLSFNAGLLTLSLLCLPLLVSNNALSYDVFNYIFNAKMVVVFKANPHLQTATDFLYDDWTRFMHNVHTPAPYGYGWTALSLMPYLLGGGKFLATWLAFRLFSFLSLILLALTYGYTIHKKYAHQGLSWLVLLNPLLLIEIVSTNHNDLWMMVPAIWSLLLLSRQGRGEKNLAASSQGVMVGLSALLLAFSVSIKLGTLTLTPLWLVLAINSLLRNQRSHYSSLLARYWPLAASLLMFGPLLTLRSQQFHPWYLTWVLVWLPLIVIKDVGEKTKATLLTRILDWGTSVWLASVFILSFSSMLRYLPYLYAGNFEGNILWQQKLITWLPFALSMLVFSLYSVSRVKPKAAK